MNRSERQAAQIIPSPFLLSPGGDCTHCVLRHVLGNRGQDGHAALCVL